MNMKGEARIAGAGSTEDVPACFSFGIVYKRICRFAPVEVLTLTIKITASRTEPTLRLLAVYQ